MFTFVPAQDELSSNVIGLNVYNEARQNIGTIKDLVLDATTRPTVCDCTCSVRKGPSLRPANTGIEPKTSSLVLRQPLRSPSHQTGRRLGTRPGDVEQVRFDVRDPAPSLPSGALDQVKFAVLGLAVGEVDNRVFAFAEVRLCSRLPGHEECSVVRRQSVDHRQCAKSWLMDDRLLR